MGILDKFFNSENTAKQENTISWHQLIDKDQITIALEESRDKIIAIFKHSTTCGISRMALKRFENEYAEASNVKLYFLDLRKHRDVSNAVANELNVRHESPQLIVLQNKEVVHHASHQDIDADKILKLAE